MTLDQYITKISGRYKQGNSTEHTYRGDLQLLLETLVPEIQATNEPKRQSCGAPDYIITKGDIPVGFIEAKDIGDNDLEGLKKTGNKEQFDRYKSGLSNLIITDYVDFLFFKEGNLNTRISLGKINGNTITPKPENFETFKQLFRNFTETITQTIKSPTRLAEMMAGKARLMTDIIEKSLNEDDRTGELSNLKKQMLSFQQMLISDITNKSFSDLYSQTIAYGLFAARFHDPTLSNFSREEAVKLIPRSNPFLRKLFKDIADEDLDHRLVWIIDELVSVFLASDVSSIMKDFGKSTKQEDPVIHFYETFLSSYNPVLRKNKGVWFTPTPIVNFIVRAVDDILKSDFGLPDGLSDKSKKKIKINYQGNQIEKEIHRVQILDPATGTGTFLSETIKHIHKKYQGMQGIWSKYVEDDLIPRLNGFELLMASYAMAHLKLDMLLTETGYTPTKEQRFRVYLTNSLEEPKPDTGTLWGNLLSEEADQANYIKRNTPVMCVIGNPPYSGISSNNGEWISKLIEDYKYVDGVHFNERKHWLNDDYVKFIRYGQHHIEKNGQGILAFINPHGFLDNPTFRGMRWNLLKTFDKIYTIDLHGNSKKKEISPDGSPDMNVFDIMQGVSINLFVKTGSDENSNELGKVFHYDLFGKRENKYDYLSNHTLSDIPFEEVNPEKPFLTFKPNTNLSLTEINNSFKIELLFEQSVTGTQTGNDELLMSYSSETLTNKLILISPKTEIFPIRRINYRPFDNGYMYYTQSNTNSDNIPIPKSYRSRFKVMRNMTFENFALIIGRQGQVVGDMPWNLTFVSNSIVDLNMFYRGGGMVFPLYIYPDNNAQTTIDILKERTPNLNKDILEKFSEKVKLIFLTEKNDKKGVYTPIDVLDYIYGILHSPTYREKYKEFLKIDFPRIPYPKDQDTFWKFVKFGGEIRKIHLLESDVLETPISKYPITGDNVVRKVMYQSGMVYINETQYFENVPEVAWNFYIGGYQPAQKWLKDRKDRELSVDDIRHYLKIIVALNETDRLMKEIDTISFD